MTGKADFAPEEWELVLQGPPSAGLIVATAQRGGTLRESISIAKAYVEARQHHGESELLDEIVASKPEIDHTRHGSVAELKEHGLQYASQYTLPLMGRYRHQLLDKDVGVYRYDGLVVLSQTNSAAVLLEGSLAPAGRHMSPTKYHRRLGGLPLARPNHRGNER